MARCTFTYGQIADLLAHVHHIAPERRVAFHSRLKHFQRENFPTGMKPGKGKAIAYGVDHLFKMVIALELTQSGMPPKLVVELVEHNWRILQTTTYLSMGSVAERRAANFDSSDEDEPADWCWLIRPEAMRDLTNHGVSEFDQYEAVMPAKTDELGKYVSNDYSATTGAPWRTLVINAGTLVRGVLRVIELNMAIATTDDVRADFMALMDADEAKLTEAALKLQGVMGDWKPSPPKPVRERFPPEIIEHALGLLEHSRHVLSQMFPDGMTGNETQVSLGKEDLLLLRDAGLIEVQAEGIYLTDIGFIAAELMNEELGHGKHS